MVPWCSGLAYVPVKDEIAGSNPVGTARLNKLYCEKWATSPQGLTDTTRSSAMLTDSKSRLSLS